MQLQKWLWKTESLFVVAPLSCHPNRHVVTWVYAHKGGDRPFGTLLMTVILILSMTM